jgi:uncharacterized membrane protein
MTGTLLTILLWSCALGCALLGGLYFAFSTFIMKALERTGAANGAAAMNSINVVILRSLFMPFFFGTTLGSLVLAVAGVIEGAPLMIAGGTLYVLGMFVVTMFGNVPLNNALAANPTEDTWRRFRSTWTRWNHVRTMSCLAAAALFIAELVRA